MNRPHESERWRRVVEVLLTETERLTDPNVRRRRLGEVVEELTRKGMSAQQPSARVGYLLEAARVARDRLDDYPRAGLILIQAAQMADGPYAANVLPAVLDHLKILPEESELAAAAAQLLVANGQVGDAVDILVRSAAHLGDMTAKASMLVDAATLCLARANQPITAMRHYFEAVVFDPSREPEVIARMEHIEQHYGDQNEVMEALVGTYDSLHRSNEAHAILVKLAKRAPREERPTFRLRLAEHAESRLGNNAKAFEHYVRGVESGQGDQQGFVDGMCRLAGTGITGALDRMEELFSRRGLWTELADAYETAADVESEDQARAALVFRAGELREHRLGDEEAALACYLKSFQINPAGVDYIAAGERIYRRRKDWGMVDRLIGLQIKITEEAHARSVLLTERARVRFESLDQPLGAYDAIREALKDGGQSAAAEVPFDLLDQIVTDDMAFAQIERGLQARAERATAQSDGARILLELAALQLDVRRDIDAGLTLLQAAADRQPDSERLYRRVTKQIETHGGVNALAVWLEQASARPLDEALRVEALHRSARLYRERLADVDAARRVWETILSIRPHDKDAFDAAVLAAGAVGEYPQQVRLLEEALSGRMGPSSPSPENRQNWLTLLARAHENAGDMESAMACLKALLASWPLETEALTRLCAWHASRDEWDEILRLESATMEAREARDGVVDVAGRRQLAALAEDRVGDPAAAGRYLEPLLEVLDDVENVRSMLYRLYEAAGDYPSRIRLMDGELRAATGAEQLRLARDILDSEGLEWTPEIHERSLRVVLDAEPQDRRAMERLATLYRDQDEPEQLETLLATLWALDPSRNYLDLVRERALLLADTLEAPSDAARAWESLLDLEPDDGQALSALQNLYAVEGKDDQVLAIIWRRVDNTQATDVRVRLLREAAVVAELRLGQPGEALKAWQRILADDANNTEALDEILRLAEESEVWSLFVETGAQRLKGLSPIEQLDLARRMAQVYGECLDDAASALVSWKRVLSLDSEDVDAIEALASHAEQNDDVDTALDLLAPLTESHSPQVRYRAYARRAQILGQSGSLEEAYSSWRSAADALPGDPRPFLEIRTLAVANDQPRVAAEALTGALQRADGVDERVSLNRALAKLSEDALDDGLGAASAWERVLACVPDDAEALRALKTLYAEQGRSDELLPVLDSLIRTTSDTERVVDLLTDAADRIEKAWSDKVTAFKCWQRVQRLTLGSATAALTAMSRLAAETDDWSDYADALVLEGEHVDALSARVPLIRETCHVLETRLGAPDRAFVQAHTLCELDPQALEHLLELRRLAELVDADWAWLRLSDATATMAELRVGERGMLLADAAQIQEDRLGRLDRAFDLYGQAFTASKGMVARDGLVRVAGLLEEWEEVKRLYTACWHAAPETADKIRLLRDLGRVLESDPRRWEDAFEQYVLCLQLDPSDELTREAVWRLAAAHDAWPVVVRVYELKIDQAESPEERIPLLRVLAQLQGEQLDDADNMRTTLRRAFALDPANDETRKALEAEADAREAWRELVQFYEDEAGWAEQLPQRVALYRAAAGLFRDKGEFSEAARIVRRIDEIAPGDESLIDERLELLRDAKDYADLATALERQSERSEGERRLEFLRELAELYVSRLDTPRRAEEVWERILEAAPGDNAAFGSLCASLERREAWEALADLLDRRAAILEDGPRLALLRRRAALLDDLLGRTDEACRLLADLARARPGDTELLSDLSRRARTAAHHATVVACAERTVEQVEGRARAVVLCLIGRTASEELGNPKKALSALTEALDICPDDIPLAREVASLMSQRREYEALAALLLRLGSAIEADEGESGDDLEVKARWALRLSKVQADRLFDVDEAISTVRALLDEQPEHPGALRRLRALCGRAQDADGIEEMAFRIARQSQGSEQREALIEAARDLTNLGDVERAASLWREVLLVAPGHREAQEAVVRHAERHEDWSMLLEQLQARLSTTEVPAQRGALLAEVGEIQHRRLGDLQAADESYALARTLAPRSLSALAGHASLILDRGDPADVAAIAETLRGRLRGEKSSKIVNTLTPIYANLQILRAEHIAETDDVDASVRLLAVVHAELGDYTPLGQVYATALYDRGDLAEAAKVYESLPFDLEGEDEMAEEHLRRGRAFRAIGRDATAVRHFEAAAAVDVTRPVALECLANLQESAGRWEAAARYRERLADAVEDPQWKRAAMVAAGMILHQRLSKPARAMDLFEEAIDAGLVEPMLLRRIVTVFQDNGRFSRALDLVERLIEGEQDPNQRAELMCMRASVLATQGQLDEARFAYLEALEESPLYARAAEGLFGLLSGATIRDQKAAVRRIRDGVREAQGPDRVGVLEHLGRWLEREGDIAEALAVFEEIHAVDRDRMTTRAALARLYGAVLNTQTDAETIRRAIGHRLASISGAPGEPEALRHLIVLCRAAGRPRWAALPLSVLVFTHQAQTDEIQAYEQMMDVHGGRFPTISEAQRVDLVAGPERRGPVALLMNALHSWIEPQLDPMLRAARAAIDARSVEPDVALLGLSDRLAHALELPPRALRVDAGADNDFELVGLRPPSLVLSSGLTASADQHRRRFVLARGLELTREGAVHAGCFPRSESLALFGAAIALSLPEQGPEYAVAAGAAIDRIEYWATFLLDHLGPEHIDALTQLAGPVLAAGTDAFTQWADGTVASACRLGFVVSGNLAGAAAALRDEGSVHVGEPIEGEEAFVSLLRDTPALAELHAYAFSSRFFELLWAQA